MLFSAVFKIISVNLHEETKIDGNVIKIPVEIAKEGSEFDNITDSIDLGLPTYIWTFLFLIF